jgi:hypothetical protein
MAHMLYRRSTVPTKYASAFAYEQYVDKGYDQTYEAIWAHHGSQIAA